jgi:hypothetical protein
MSKINKIEPTKTTTCEIILNNNFGTPQSEKIFQYLISVYKKHNSRSVDDAVMFSVTSTIADILDEVVKVANSKNPSEEEYAPFDTLISEETDRYKNLIINQILQYITAFPKIAKIGPEINLKNVKQFSDLNFPSYLAICPSHFSDLYNWENSENIDGANAISTEETTENRENIYDSVLEDLDYLDCLLNDDNKASEGVTFTDVLNAFARYQLYRHTSLHRLYYKDLEILVKKFSELYSVNLKSRFVKCSCCGEISIEKTF